jgi:mycothiol synthase
MRVVPLTQDLIPAFLEYCARYGPEHDESYLPGEQFAVDSDNPTFLLLDDGDKLAGVASLMLDKAYRAARKGRFRILHALEPSARHYQALVAAILPAAQSVDEVYLFIPEGRRAIVGGILEGLGFGIERYSWYLKRRTVGMPEAAFPRGFTLRPVRRGVDEAAWAAVVNVAFAHLRGHLESTAESVRAMYDEPSHRDEGMLALWAGPEMVGTVRVTDEGTEDVTEAFVGALALLPAYQHRGLGRNLLRAAAAVGRRWGLEWVSLSVNAENERAAELYFKEGFEKIELYVCYSLPWCVKIPGLWA